MPPLKLKNVSYPDPERIGLHEATYDMGRDGSKWRHGWIPLNPAAVAIKAKKPTGGGSSGGGSGDALKAARAHRASGLMMMSGADLKREASNAGVSPTGSSNQLRARIMIAEEKARRAAPPKPGGKSRLSTSTVRPSRLKLKGDKGREASAPKFKETQVGNYTARELPNGMHAVERTSSGHHYSSHGTHTDAVAAATYRHSQDKATNGADAAFLQRGNSAVTGPGPLAKVHPSESLHEIITRNMGSDLTKAKSSDLRTYAQFGHQPSRDELGRRAMARSGPAASRAVDEPMTPREHVLAAVDHNDKAVAAMKAGDLKTANDYAEAARHHNQRAMSKASADDLAKLRDKPGGKNLVDEEIRSRLEAEKARRAASSAEVAKSAPHTTIISLKVTGLEGYGVNDLKRIAKLSEGPHDTTHAPADTIAKAERELRNRGYIKSPNGSWVKPRAR